MESAKLNIVIQNLQNLLDRRLEKLWRLFSWTSTIMVSIIGGVFVLARMERVVLTTEERIIISMVIIVFTVYSYLMLRDGLANERKIRDRLDKLFEDDIEYPLYKELRPDNSKFGYSNVVIMMSFLALAAAWVN